MTKKNQPDLKTKLELLAPALRMQYELRSCTICKNSLTDLELEKCIDNQILCVCDICFPEFKKRMDQLAGGLSDLAGKGIK